MIVKRRTRKLNIIINIIWAVLQTLLRLLKIINQLPFKIPSKSVSSIAIPDAFFFNDLFEPKSADGVNAELVRFPEVPLFFGFDNAWNNYKNIQHMILCYIYYFLFWIILWKGYGY